MTVNLMDRVISVHPPTSEVPEFTVLDTKTYYDVYGNMEYRISNPVFLREMVQATRANLDLFDVLAVVEVLLEKRGLGYTQWDEDSEFPKMVIR